MIIAPPKVPISCLRHRGRFTTTAWVVSCESGIFFLPVDKDPELYLMAQESLRPGDEFLVGRYSEVGKAVIEFEDCGARAENLRTRMVAAFYHDVEALNRYSRAMLVIDGQARGVIGQLVDLLRHQVRAERHD